MQKKIYIFIGILLISNVSQLFADQNKKIFVIERESKSVSVIENNNSITRMKNIGDTNHATIKFLYDFAYILSRDGIITKIHVPTLKIQSQKQVGNSSIGFTFIDDHIAIANYDPKNIIILNKNLQIIKEIYTDSRNVGIKEYHHKCIFSLMDKNEIWVISAKDNFSLEKKIKLSSEMPFDALQVNEFYINGFYNSSQLGSLNADTLEYQPIDINSKNNEISLKIPHFGTWGVTSRFAYIPQVKSKKIIKVDLLNMKINNEITLPGTPIFASVSLTHQILVVNYSGELENFISIIDLKTDTIIKTFTIGQRVMHLRFDEQENLLYISTYFDNTVHVFNIINFTQTKNYTIAYPSGIFIWTKKA